MAGWVIEQKEPRTGKETGLSNYQRVIWTCPDCLPLRLPRLIAQKKREAAACTALLPRGVL